MFIQKDTINYTQELLFKYTNKKFTKNYIEKYILPIITHITNSKKKKFLISGSQGVGKSTLVLILKSVIEKHPKQIRMLITGYTDVEVIKEAINEGHVYKYIDKPWNNDQLKNSIDKALEVYLLREENQQLTKDLKRVNSQLEFMLRQRLSSE